MLTARPCLCPARQRPRWDARARGHVLNFHGRVTVSSVKNFQLKEKARLCPPTASPALPRSSRPRVTPPPSRSSGGGPHGAAVWARGQEPFQFGRGVPAVPNAGLCHLPCLHGQKVGGVQSLRAVPELAGFGGGQAPRVVRQRARLGRGGVILRHTALARARRGAAAAVPSQIPLGPRCVTAQVPPAVEGWPRHASSCASASGGGGMGCSTTSSTVRAVTSRCWLKTAL